MTKPHLILGVHDGHNSTAALVADGVVVAAVQEERLTRRKNEVGYPRRAIEDCLRIAGFDAKDLAEVSYASLFMHKTDYLENLEPWYCTGLSHQRSDMMRPKQYERVIFDQRKAERIRQIEQHLGVDPAKVSFVEHHLAHLAAAHYTAPDPNPGKPFLALTCDGAGDNLAATVSIVRGNDIERISVTDRHASLGKIYSRVTMLLGMRPWEHEYKIMGMAPYTDPERANRAADALRELVKLDADGLRFVQAGELSTNYCYEHLRERFERVRFDTICGATQLFTEELLVAWVRAAIRKTGISDVIAGGGVFMNVKANKAIAEIPELTSFYVVPSGGDESLAFGAALYRYFQAVKRPYRRGDGFANLYLGGAYTLAEETAALRAADAGTAFDVVETDDVDRLVVDHLAAGRIVGRCRGRMEWGARALGNRSLIASAENPLTVERLNAAIKQRDFWMPFAPSIREEAQSRYFADPKGIKPHYMQFAFDGTIAARRDLTAATHARDHTLRPQLVTKAGAPDYHRLISLFEAKTGRGGVLNTSFNIHGEPIVYGPAEAIDVFMRSGLDHIALERHVLSKKTAH